MVGNDNWVYVEQLVVNIHFIMKRLRMTDSLDETDREFVFHHYRSTRYICKRLPKQLQQIMKEVTFSID
ncbi:hypothetical protein [Oceanobacillus saliphilus]|uniref:hypothetical protein n=1 Tax=Oceanobacillus saliphilus TaxID=2925834 RepID=UPI00201DB5A8|nr:hypothetical protein [Oceanobacillus saliphilus]